MNQMIVIKNKAKNEVMDAIGFWSGKSLVRAISILSGVVSSISEACRNGSVEFNELALLSKPKANKYKVFEAMIGRGQSCLIGMKRRINLEKLQVLTGLAALFVLPPHSGMYKTSCRLLGINRNSNYVARGLENRAACDKFLELTGDIETNEVVVCRDGFGKLVSESEDLLTISLEPWQFEKT